MIMFFEVHNLLLIAFVPIEHFVVHFVDSWEHKWVLLVCIEQWQTFEWQWGNKSFDVCILAGLPRNGFINLAIARISAVNG